MPTNSNCRSTMDAREHNVVLQFHASKYVANFCAEWRDSDEHTLIEVQHQLNARHPPNNISMAELKAIVTSLEEKVRRYKVRSVYGYHNMFLVFILGPFQR